MTLAKQVTSYSQPTGVPSHNPSSRNTPLLFGRDRHEKLLLEAYQRRTCRTSTARTTRPELTLITGASGTGKTVLAKTLERRVRAERGYFCTGKCEQQHHNANFNYNPEPFAPFQTAVTQLIHTVLKQQQDDSGEELVRLEEALEEATRDGTSTANSAISTASPFQVQLLTSLFPVFRRVLQELNDGDCDCENPDSSAPASPQVPNTTTTTTTSATGETPAMVIFANFLKAFCCVEHPIVMLLDDWQWLDTGSLALLKTILSSSDNIPGLMILGTCRGNEVTVQDPLSVLLRTLEDQQQVPIMDIQLGPLSVTVVQDMIAHLLLQLPASTTTSTEESMHTTRALAEWMHPLTGGNPFFIQQNLRALQDAKRIYFSNGSWHWDETAIDIIAGANSIREDRSSLDDLETAIDIAGAVSIRDDSSSLEDPLGDPVTTIETGTRLLDAAVRKLAQQSQAIQETLTIAAFLGAPFSVNHLQKCVSAAVDLPAIPQALVELVEQGILCGDLQQLEQLNCNGTTTIFRWTHDRFQQSAYCLVPNHQRQEYSVQMGRQLLASLQAEEIEEHPFLLANLFLRDLSLLMDDVERVQVADLLHLAGTKAAASSAFNSAAAFFSQGIHLLETFQQQAQEEEKEQIAEQPRKQQQSAWEQEYDLCLALHNGAIEMECCNGHFEHLDQLFKEVIQNAVVLEDKLRAYEAKISSLAARHMDAEAVQLGFKVLKKLGEPFPKKAVLLHTLAATAKTVLWLRRATTESILKTRPMRRWDKIAALRILQIMVASIIRANPEYSALWACRGVQLTIEYGFCHMSAPIFMALGMILGTTVVGLADDARRCAEIAHQLDQQYHAPEWLCRLLVYEYGYINWWHRPFADSLRPLIAGARAGAISGDVHMAYIHATFYSFYGFFTGSVPLNDHIAAMEDQYAHFERLDQKMLFIGLSLEFGRVLCSEGAGLPRLSEYSSFCNNGTRQDELRWGRKDPALLVISLSLQLMHSVYTNDWKTGLSIWKRVSRMPYDEIYAVVCVAQLHFLHGMLEVMKAHDTGKNKRWAGRRGLKNLRALQKKMNCPDNIINKIDLLEAERAVLRGDTCKARNNFMSSIEGATKSNAVQEAALAYERLADALSLWGLDEQAKQHRQKSAVLYQKWGFSRKAAHLTMHNTYLLDRQHL